jgi:hypothetical protein
MRLPCRELSLERPGADLTADREDLLVERVDFRRQIPLQTGEPIGVGQIEVRTEHAEQRDVDSS